MVDLPEEYKELVSGPENVDRGHDVHGGDHGRKGRHKKKSTFFGKSPKQRTPPTHRYGLGLT